MTADPSSGTAANAPFVAAIGWTPLRLPSTAELSPSSAGLRHVTTMSPPHMHKAKAPPARARINTTAVTNLTPPGAQSLSLLPFAEPKIMKTRKTSTTRLATGDARNTGISRRPPTRDVTVSISAGNITSVNVGVSDVSPTVGEWV